MQTQTLRYNFRLKPKPKQEEKLAQFGAYARGVWNLMLSECIRRYNYDKTFLSYGDMWSLAKSLKAFEEFAWVKAFDQAALQQVLRDLDEALRNATNKKRLQRLPKHKVSYKKKKLHDDAFRCVNTNNSVRLENGCLRIPKIGLVPIVLHRKLVSSIKSVTIEYRHGKWTASIVQEVPVAEPKHRISSLSGYDINSNQIIVGSNGLDKHNPKYLKQSEQKLKQLQRQLARRKKGSARWHKTKQRINKLHGRIARQRHDMLHQLSNTIAKASDLVIFEDLNVRGMQRFNGSMISDNGMAKITDMVKYKVKREGGLYHEINRYAKSTGVCISCHQEHSLTLSDRSFTCTNCGTHQIRDVASAHTIERIGINELIATGAVVRDIPNAQEKLSGKTKVFKRLKFDNGLEKNEVA